MGNVHGDASAIFRERFGDIGGETLASLVRMPSIASLGGASASTDMSSLRPQLMSSPSVPEASVLPLGAGEPPRPIQNAESEDAGGAEENVLQRQASRRPNGMIVV